MALNTVTIMAKFFKAFGANARLQLVTDTLVRAASDLFHFMVVFSAIFIAYALVGHILFGGDSIYFNSFGSSVNTAFIALLGDFGWYTEFTETQEPLASGMPYTVVAIWFWSYMIFVVLVLLNMLLAIIMSHHDAAVQDLAKSVDAPALWVQASRYYKRYKMSKGWVPNNDILVQLQDDTTARTHPQPEATAETLMEAFPTMPEKQANAIMNELITGAAAQAGIDEEDPSLTKLKELQACMDSLAEHLHVITIQTSNTNRRLGAIERRLDSLDAAVSIKDV